MLTFLWAHWHFILSAFSPLYFLKKNRRSIRSWKVLLWQQAVKYYGTFYFSFRDANNFVISLGRLGQIRIEGSLLMFLPRERKTWKIWEERRDSGWRKKGRENVFLCSRRLWWLSEGRLGLDPPSEKSISPTVLLPIVTIFAKLAFKEGSPDISRRAYPVIPLLTFGHKLQSKDIWVHSLMNTKK